MDPQELLEKLKARGARAKCPMCSASQWAAPPVEKGDLEGIPFGYGLIGVPLACVQCGFIRFHSLNVLDAENYTDADLTPPTDRLH